MPSQPNQVPAFSPAPLHRRDKFKDAIELLQAAANPTPKPTLVESFGTPAALNANNQISGLNEPFWAGHYRDQHPETIYEPKEDKFYDYDSSSGLFVHTTENNIRKTIAEHILDASRQWSNQEGLSKFRNDRHLRGIIAHLKGLVEEPGAFVRKDQLIHLQNCVLRLRPDGTFATEPFSPKHRFRSGSPISYDPEATCPKFEKCLLSHWRDDDRELIQKYAGQCLTGRNLTQRILILEGVAGASKGALVLVIRGIIGINNVYELRTKQLEERFEIGRMAGKSLLLGADVKANFLSTPSAARLKSLVGGDTLEIESKRNNESQSMNGDKNAIVTANSRLRVHLEGDEGAWERRLTIASADNPYSGKTIPNIDEILLKEEGPGILNWCLTGLKQLFQDISGETGTLVLSKRQREKVHNLLSESDSLKIYIRENIVKTSSADDDLTKAEIIEAYNQYCVTCEWTPRPFTAAQKQLEDLMLEVFSTTVAHSVLRDGKGQRGFRRVRFRRNDED